MTGGARDSAMDTMHATAETLQTMLEHLKAVEEMRRTLRNIREANKIDIQ